MALTVELQGAAPRLATVLEALKQALERWEREGVSEAQWQRAAAAVTAKRLRRALDPRQRLGRLWRSADDRTLGQVNASPLRQTYPAWLAAKKWRRTLPPP